MPNDTRPWSLARAREVAATAIRSLRADAAGPPPASASTRDVAPSSSVREDGYANPVTGHGTSRDKRKYTQFQSVPVVDLVARDLWRSSDLCARIIEKKTNEAFREGYKIKTDDAEDIEKSAEDLRVNEIVRHARHMERAYGGSAIFPVLETTGDLSTPLEETRIGHIDALHVFEPRELTPASWYRDIRSPKYGMPESYRLLPITNGVLSFNYAQTIVHESRLIVMPGRRITREFLGGQRSGWGDSELMPADEVIADYGIAWTGVGALLAEFAGGTLYMDQLAELSATKGGRMKIEARLAAMDIAASTIKLRVVDAKDKFAREQTPISGLSDIIVQFAQRVAAAADMPLTILLGMSPAGLNATGDMDIRSWYDRVAVEQHRMQHFVQRVLRLVMLAIDGPTNGKVPDVWSIEWNPLWQPTDQETATTRLAIAQADALNIANGQYSGAEAAKSHYGGEVYSPVR